MKKFYKTGLISIALVLFLIACTASTVTAENVSPTVTVTRIATGVLSYWNQPAIYNDKIVWEDYRNGYENSDIYMYDISTGKETQITTSGSAHFPDIYGDRIVWIDERNKGSNSGYYYDVYMYDLSTGKETQISADGSAYDYESPSISGDKIVWQGSEDNIYVHNLSTNETIEIVTEQQYPGTNLRLDIFNDKIVYWDTRDAYGTEFNDGILNPNIYMYNLSTNKETQITTSKSAVGKPSIYDDKIVWVDNRDGKDDIYMYDISTKKETLIKASEEVGCSTGSPKIYGDRIVWSDSCYSDEYSNIRMYNLSTSTETLIARGNAWYLDVYGDKIVWIEGHNGDGGIYMATLTWDEEPPLDDNNTDDSNGIDNETQVPDDCSSELTPLDRTQALKEYVECTYKCNVKTKTGLATLLDTSMCHYENCDNKKAVSMLKSFIHLAEKMRVCKQISAEEADYMVKEARKIIDLIETH